MRILCAINHLTQSARFLTASSYLPDHRRLRLQSEIQTRSNSSERHPAMTQLIERRVQIYVLAVLFRILIFGAIQE
jgi:hypothetical protein